MPVIAHAQKAVLARRRVEQEAQVYVLECRIIEGESPLIPALRVSELQTQRALRQHGRAVGGGDRHQHGHSVVACCREGHRLYADLRPGVRPREDVQADAVALRVGALPADRALPGVVGMPPVNDLGAVVKLDRRLLPVSIVRYVAGNDAPLRPRPRAAMQEVERVAGETDGDGCALRGVRPPLSFEHDAGLARVRGGIHDVKGHAAPGLSA